MVTLGTVWRSTIGVIIAAGFLIPLSSTPTAAALPPVTLTPACGTPTPGHARCLSAVVDDGLTPDSASPTGLAPSSITTAYGFPNASTGGTGETIAIVDAYDDPTIVADLAAFNAQYGLPSCTVLSGCFTEVNESGGAVLPTAYNQGWSLETSLDVEWAHAIAPGAHILLVEASTNEYVDLMTAESYAVSQASYVSNSWGGPEFAGEEDFDPEFVRTGVSVFVAAGDTGAEVEYPAASPDVISVGGTSLGFTSGGVLNSESAWTSGGGGCSAYESASAAQSAFSQYPAVGCAGTRSTPDLSAIAATSGGGANGVSVYDSNYSSPPWVGVDGTSVATPIVTAQAADAGAVVTPASIYGQSMTFRDVTSGSNGHPATAGYDLATGRGSWINVPGAPTTPSVSMNSNAVSVQWTAPSTGGTPTSYTLWRGTTSGGETALATGLTGTSDTDASVTPGDTYYYTVTATDALGPGPSSGEAHLTVPIVIPDAPTAVTANANTNGSVGITWTAPADNGATITSYAVTPSPPCPGCGGLTVTGNPAAASATVTGLTVGTSYSFTVTATNSGGTSPPSSASNAVTPVLTTPGPPGPAQAEATTGSVTVRWSAPTSGSTATSYTVSRSTASGQETTLAAGLTSTTYTDTAVAAGTTYYYTVAAVNSFGTSEATAEVHATVPVPPTPPPPTPPSQIAPPSSAAPHGLGYWLVASDGGIFAFGAARFYGSTGADHLAKPIVGMASTPDGGGYWLVASDGGIFAFGDARFYGSTGADHLAKPIVGMASTPDGGGYWLVASDGGIFAFGDARFYGSTGAFRLAEPIVGMASTPDGGGYWLVASDGGIFAFGDAGFFGSTGGRKLTEPIVGIASTPDGHGYWLVASDGGIFAFGDATFDGSTGAVRLAKPIVGMAATPDGGGYWLVASDGGIFAFGDASFYGSTGADHLAKPIVGPAAV